MPCRTIRVPVTSGKETAPSNFLFEELWPFVGQKGSERHKKGQGRAVFRPSPEICPQSSRRKKKQSARQKKEPPTSREPQLGSTPDQNGPGFFVPCLALFCLCRCIQHELLAAVTVNIVEVVVRLGLLRWPNNSMAEILLILELV